MTPHPKSTSKRSGMRHQCPPDADGRVCFNRQYRWDFGLYHDALPFRCQFTDIDCITEVGGAVFIVETKHPRAKPARAQEILMQNVTKMEVPGKGQVNGAAFVVATPPGDGECEWKVHRFRVCFRGEWGEWREEGADALHNLFKTWATRVKAL